MVVVAALAATVTGVPPAVKTTFTPEATTSGGERRKTLTLAIGIAVFDSYILFGGMVMPSALARCISRMSGRTLAAFYRAVPLGAGAPTGPPPWPVVLGGD